MLVLCPVGPDSVSFAINQPVYVPCSGNGRCLSLREVALYQDYEAYNSSTVYDDWDADMIHGCVCDRGWEGVAGERKSCQPKETIR
jgi:hypothetical protein